MKKRRCDFMTVTEIQKAFNEHCMNNECNHCKYSPTNCNFSFALDEVEVFDIKNWADEIYALFLKDKYADYKTLYNVTFVVIREHNSLAVKKIGIARCNKTDTFVSEIGIAIAYAKAKGIKIPKEIYQ